MSKPTSADLKSVDLSAPAPPTDVPEELRDRVFTDPGAGSRDFKFGSATAAVFDDMVGRSVPFYGEIQRMCCEVAADFAVPGTTVYDLGCSTATTLAALDPLVDPGVRFVGVDNSDDMLAKAREKLGRMTSGRSYELVNADLNEFRPNEEASVIMVVLTMQFVRPLYRERIVRRLYDGLKENGALILVEKLITSHSLLNRLFIRYYYDHKRRVGYSDMEISQKREALENVLIPYRHEENVQLLSDAGFRHVEEFFRWYNFNAVVAVK